MRILVIEDYRPLRQAVTAGLQEEGYAVDAAADGDEGWWHIQAATYDLIILDLMLPGISGTELLRRLQARGAATHVLVLTARDTIDERVAGLDLGADDYLIKPFAFPELLARIRSLLRRTYGAKDPVIRIADLAIDTASRTARRGDQVIELTSREYHLLEFLALRQGQLVTRTEIWEHLYDLRSETSSNVVDVYVGYLRKKIERTDLPRLIHTRRGLGYVLGLTAC